MSLALQLLSVWLGLNLLAFLNIVYRYRPVARP